MTTLADLRRDGGAAAVRKAIEAALAKHGTATDAAAALGTTPSNLRRAAQRTGAAWPDLPPGPPAAKSTGRKKKRAAPLASRSSRI